jgi:LysR family transcriptional regulator, nod-box dependent transcriptional activator
MRLNRLDMNLTLCLDALLAERNVSRAATRLFVSQPAMSIALRRLREHFNDELMVQTGRSYRLTSFAESLQRPVRDVVLQMQAISGWRPNFDPAKSDRTITIGASDYVLTVYIIKALARVYAQAPGMHVAVRLLNSNYLEDLDSGEIDLLIIPNALASESHPSDVLFTDTFSCVVWKDNTLVKRSITRNQYLKLGHVITEWDGGRLDSLDEMVLSRLGYRRRREIVAPGFTLAPQFVVGTQRIATVQTQLANAMAERWPIRVLRCPIEIPPIVEMVQWHKYQERDPAILWFIELLKTVATELSDKPQRGT